VIPLPTNSIIKTPFSFFEMLSNVNSFIVFTIGASLYSNSFYSEAINPSKLTEESISFIALR
jgi:hypothetical protein